MIDEHKKVVRNLWKWKIFPNFALRKSVGKSEIKQSIYNEKNISALQPQKGKQTWIPWKNGDQRWSQSVVSSSRKRSRFVNSIWPYRRYVLPEVEETDEDDSVTGVVLSSCFWGIDVRMDDYYFDTSNICLWMIIKMVWGMKKAPGVCTLGAGSRSCLIWW